jgi:hypothetical protein
LTTAEYIPRFPHGKNISSAEAKQVENQLSDTTYMCLEDDLHKMETKTRRVTILDELAHNLNVSFHFRSMFYFIAI